MREILFRAKSKRSGEWVYGSLISAGDYCCILESEENAHPMDYPYLDSDLGTIDGQLTPVVPETVGRLINGPCYDGVWDGERRFFEGDIIGVYRWEHRHVDINSIEPDSLAIVVDEHSITENGLGRWFPQDTITTKVLGNVYDNPELIGEKYADLYKYYHGYETTITRDDLKKNIEG